MKKTLFLIAALLAAIQGFSQDNRPGGYEATAFKLADFHQNIIVMDGDYTIPSSLKVEVYNNGVKLSDTTAVTIVGDTIKFKLTPAQLAPLVRAPVIYLKDTLATVDPYLLAINVTVKSGYATPTGTDKTVYVKKMGNIRVSFVGDASTAIYAANRAKLSEQLAIAARDSSNRILDSMSVNYISRLKFGASPTLRSTTESISAFHLVEGSKSGILYYDPTDLSSADDSVMVIVRSDGKRYKRSASEPVRPEMFGAAGDGSTNDYVALQRMINAASGRVIEFSRGKTYKINTGLSVLSNRTIIGNGATITTGNLSWITAITIQSRDKVVIDGLNIDGGSGQNAFDFAIKIMDSRDVTLKNCRIENIGYENAVTERGFGVLISSSSAHSAPTSSTGCQNIQIINNNFYNIKGYGLARGDFLVVYSSDNVLIDGNTMDKSCRQGIVIIDYATNIKISNNTIKNTYLAGVDLEPDTSPGGAGTHNITIDNNYIYGFGIKPAGPLGSQFYGVDVHNYPSEVIVSNNHFVATSTQAISAIHSQNGAKTLSFTNNIIRGGGVLQNGITLSAGSGSIDVTIEGGFITDFTNYGITGYVVTGLKVSNVSISSSVGKRGISMNQSESNISGVKIALAGAGVEKGIYIFNTSKVSVVNCEVSVSAGHAYHFLSGSGTTINLIVAQNMAINSSTATTGYFFEASANTNFITPIVRNNTTSGAFTTSVSGDIMNFVNAVATSAPSKSTLNTTYGLYPAETMVRYTAITGGVRSYRKLGDASSADWEETIWSTGVKSLAL